MITTPSNACVIDPNAETFFAGLLACCRASRAGRFVRTVLLTHPIHRQNNLVSAQDVGRRFHVCLLCLCLKLILHAHALRDLGVSLRSGGRSPAFHARAQRSARGPLPPAASNGGTWPANHCASPFVPAQRGSNPSYRQPSHRRRGG